MKIWYLVLIFLLLVPSIYSSEFSEYKSLDINTRVDFGSKVTYGSGGYVIDYIEINLTLFPKEDYGQKVLSFDTNSVPSSDTDVNDDYIIYRWGSNFLSDSLRVYVDSSVRTETFNKHIDRKIDFPIIGLSEDVRVYLKEGEKTDINDEIRERANEIVAGEDDLFFAVYKIAEWVKKEVPYDLNTLTENAVQSSSWVFINREGVCDEITGLFISMLRSVGVPARFVSGTVYTNTLDDWGNHGWAEVYFPGYGWIPFDVTFGQYGWVDSTHVVLDKSLDTEISSLKYHWKTYNVNFKPENLKIETKLINKSEGLSKLVDLKVKSLEDDVANGSYIPLQVTIENLQPYYVSTIVYFTKSSELLENNTKQVLLKPFERRNLFWITQIPTTLDRRYIYTEILEVKDFFGSVSENKLRYYDNGKYISLKNAQDKIGSLTEKEEKMRKSSLSFNCYSDKEFYYSYDRAFVNCSIVNEGNVKLKNIEFCFNKCETFALNILEEKNFVFNLDNLSEDKKFVMKYNGDVNEEVIKVKILEVPDLNIMGLSFNNEIDYNAEGKIDLVLNSSSICKDLEVDFGFVKKNFKDIDGEKRLSFNFLGKNVINIDKVKVSCKDLNGKIYSDENEIKIKVNKIPFFVKIWQRIYNLFSKI